MKPIGEVIDDLYALRARRMALSKEVDELKAQEAELRGIIITQLRDIGLDGGKGSTANALITTSTQAQITNWPAFFEYIRETGGGDLVQKRVAIQAVRDRWDSGEEIPGLTAVEVVDLSLTKRR